MSLRISMVRGQVVGLIMDLYRMSERARRIWPDHIVGEIARRGKKIVINEIDATTKTRTGRLKRSVRAEKIAEPAAWRISVTAPYALIVELGRAGGKIIRPVRRKALAFEKEGVIKVKGKVVQGGFPGRRFFERSLPQIEEMAKNVFIQEINRELDRYPSLSGRTF